MNDAYTVFHSRSRELDIVARLGGSYFKWMVGAVSCSCMQRLRCTYFLHIHSYIHKGNQGKLQEVSEFAGFKHDSLTVPLFSTPEFRDVVGRENSS